MKRIFSDDIIEAYKQTGVEPCKGEWFDTRIQYQDEEMTESVEKQRACGLGAYWLMRGGTPETANVSTPTGISSLISIDPEFDFSYLNAWWKGFDAAYEGEDDDNNLYFNNDNPGYMDGYDAGHEVRYWEQQRTMKRITPDEVVAAYRETGAEPVAGYFSTFGYDDEGVRACGLGVYWIKYVNDGQDAFRDTPQGVSELVALGFDEEYLENWYHGFDNAFEGRGVYELMRDNPGYMDGYESGKIMREQEAVAV